MFKKKIVLTFLVIFISIIANAQCAMCKAVVQSGDVSLAEGVNNGISYLMVFPYVLIGALFFTIYRYNKKTK